MTEELRQELNRQTLEILANLLDEKKGWILCCIIKEMGDDKYQCMLGPEVGPKQFVHALAQIMPGIEEWNDKIEGN